MIKQKMGFTVLETVASIFIITLVLVTAMSIILTMRNHAIQSEEKIKSTDIATFIRSDLESDYDYQSINTWLNDSEKSITIDDCIDSPISCDIFSYQVDGKDYSNLISIRFLQPTELSTSFEIIHYEITIIYFKQQTVMLEGAIYA